LFGARPVKIPETIIFQFNTARRRKFKSIRDRQRHAVSTRLSPRELFQFGERRIGHADAAAALAAIGLRALDNFSEAIEAPGDERGGKLVERI